MTSVVANLPEGPQFKTVQGHENQNSPLSPRLKVPAHSDPLHRIAVGEKRVFAPRWTLGLKTKNF